MKRSTPSFHRSFRPAERDAQALAPEILGFLAADEERLSRFLALTGLDPGGLRAAAHEPGFAENLLAYLCGEETLLVAFASEHDDNPQRIGALHAALSSWDPDG